MQIKLSIGSAVYNLEESLLRAHIEGIMCQLTDEVELLLIDDCSANNSGEICREYAARDSRIRYIKMEKNGGLSLVRNCTIAQAAGEWIFFADGDDLLSAHFVETALRFSDTQNDIIIHERVKFTDRVAAEQPCAVTQLTQLPEEAGRTLSVSCLCLDPRLGEQFGLPARAFYHAAWGALYRKAFLETNGLQFPVGQKKAQDAVFNTRVYHCARRIAYLPYVMYYYRSNAQGITHRYSGDLPAISRSLLGHLTDCMQTFYPGDADVKARFENHRVMATVMDNLRLNFFHKDNPNPKKERKKAFLAFIDAEPYRTAICRFDAGASGRYEWLLPVRLIRKRNFAALDLFVGNETAYRLLCGAYKHLKKRRG